MAVSEQKLTESHALGSIEGTIACLRAMIDAKTPPPSGHLGGQLAQGLFALVERETGSSVQIRNAALKGYCDGIQQTMMGQLVPGSQPPMISGDVPLPDTPEIQQALAELVRLTKGKQ